MVRVFQSNAAYLMKMGYWIFLELWLHGMVNSVRNPLKASGLHRSKGQAAGSGEVEYCWLRMLGTITWKVFHFSVLLAPRHPR